MNRQQLVDLAVSHYPIDLMNKHQEKYGYDPKGMTKFFNHEFQWSSCAERVEYLGVKAAPPTLKIVDVGSAMGHFAFILKSLGHDVSTIDVPNFPAYPEALKILGIPVVEEFVKAKTPLPGDFRNVDLITATGINFDVSEDPQAVWNGGMKLWTLEEWKYFLNDVLYRLNPGGRLLVGFNYNWPAPTPQAGHSTVWVTEQPGFFHWLRHHELVRDARMDMPRLVVTRNEKTV